MKDPIAVMCHNIAKCNREQESPDLTLFEAAEKLESLADDADSIEPEKYGGAKLVDVTFHVPGDIKALRCAASYLRKIAAGEYKPVVHARWEWVEISPIKKELHCSNCGFHGFRTPHCPYCGAFMDGKDESQ